MREREREAYINEREDGGKPPTHDDVSKVELCSKLLIIFPTTNDGTMTLGLEASSLMNFKDGGYWGKGKREREKERALRRDNG